MPVPAGTGTSANAPPHADRHLCPPPPAPLPPRRGRIPRSFPLMRAPHRRLAVSTMYSPLSGRAWRGLLLAMLMLLAACSERSADWSLYNVKGHLPDLKFSLPGAHGKTVSSDDLKGKTVLLFFGYASCPDVCPTTMAQLTAVLQQLGEQARDVRILFVSVDPHRDTPDILQAYVNAFNNNAIGVTGNEKQIADLARRYRVAYQIEKPKPGDDADIYDVTHSRGVYIFDNQGKARLLASDTDTIDTMVKDLRQLIAQTQ
ncbi:SCO1/SenC [Bordetella bronchiseptica MBORD624]|nr:SCO1/SenC [Bordetella bronchiseptica 00-P-2796]KDC68865.1 SCO1/SenC [Bordetella bronchiseptica MBORD624]KDD24343.1 SCO1/SenC [Bordetella bronchiseptica MBORD782]KDD34238.1 SCO1/SenC [Bordetella bronchiseptica MBORD839]KDD60361.1 SCO1/SenC [Bordetella bronchiseptica SO10328]